MNELINTIITPGIISFLVTLLMYFMHLAKYKEKVDTHEKNIDKHDDKISKLSDKISTIEGGLGRYVKSKSPLTLTEEGEELLINSGGKRDIDLNKDIFLQEIKKRNPQTAYDVQELAKKVIENRTNNHEFNNIKEYAFNNGLKLDIILEVLGIYLRDISLLPLGFEKD